MLWLPIIYLLSTCTMSRLDADYSLSVDGEEMMSEHEGDSGVESTHSADSMLYIRISIPDLNIQVGLCCYADAHLALLYSTAVL